MPTREQIKPKVVAVIAAVSQVPPSKIQEEDRLEVDLGLTKVVRRALAIPYSKISEGYPGGIRVTMKDAEEQRTVKSSIDLVHKRANGKSS